jgi:hypothetical protein
MNERSLRTLLTLLALVQLAIGCWMTFATNSFGKRVAPFDHVDLHDLRDFATYFLALGFVLLLAGARPGWRFPILALATLEYALHTVNHAVDITPFAPRLGRPRRPRSRRQRHRRICLARVAHRAVRGLAQRASEMSSAATPRASRLERSRQTQEEA